MSRTAMIQPSREQVSRIFEILRSASTDDPTAAWDAFGPADWPALFALLDLAADMPRWRSHPTVSAFPGGLWPGLDSVRSDLGRLQDLVDHPAVPKAARSATTYGPDDLDEAVRELRGAHCVHVDFLLAPKARAELDQEIERLGPDKLGSWGELGRSEGPGVYELFEGVLDGEAFRRLCGFDLKRDEYTLTLSLQDLEIDGIGWHRDLYWPKEWVGEDVFAVLYALGSDTPERGGAFLHYVPWSGELYAHYRQRHQATILWNSADSSGRLIHAVSRYLTKATARHLIILQCHRRSS